MLLLSSSMVSRPMPLSAVSKCAGAESACLIELAPRDLSPAADADAAGCWESPRSKPLGVGWGGAACRKNLLIL